MKSKYFAKIYLTLNQLQGNGESCQLPNARNNNELVFDLYKELSAASLKSYINIQLTQMILKVTQDGTNIQHVLPNTLTALQDVILFDNLFL